MATRINSTIPYESSGVFFKETDLTVVSNNTGGFSAAAIGLTERGPAFEITSSATFDVRQQRLGGLNLNYPSSYYARQYLQQAANYKEIRILGLEGYTDVKGYAISLALSGTAAAVPGSSPIVLQPSSLMAVLKERPTSMTGRPLISSVLIQAATYVDPISGISTSSATDYLFNIVINYVDSSTDTITCSLRPESKDYIVKKLWHEPFQYGNKGQQTFPLIKNQICPLWVDFVIPSEKTRPSIDKPYSYYLPGSTISQNYLPLLTGNVAFGTTQTYQSATISDAGAKVVSSTVVGATITAQGDITSYWSTGLKAITISGVTGTGNLTLVNGTWIIDNVVYDNVNNETTFDLYDYDSSIAANAPVNPLDTVSQGSTFSNTGTPLAAKYIVPTWEAEVLDFNNVIFQTPITPWFVSDGDSNGDFKKLFRIWSISDGTAANTEIKVEIRNINPTANNGNGSFDLVLRTWDDREDLSNGVVESFSNLNMDELSDNYIVRRIGDGEDFGLKSRYIFIEINSEEQIEADLLPYGVLGYPNSTGNVFSDIQWTLDYDQTKPLTKQTLGLANNNINMFKNVATDSLKYKNISNADAIGKGFHLNPNNNTIFATDQVNTFDFANQNAYKTATGGTIVPSEKVKRSRFVVDFFGGFDGWNVYNERTWGNTLSKDYEALTTAVSILSDKETLDADFTVLVTPDFFLDSDAAACEAVLDMVQQRGDCLYIPDLAYDEASDPQTGADLVTSSNMRSSSTAVYFPWLQINDTDNKKNVWLPPSLLALGTITYVAQNENVWQPPGGSIRTVTNNLIRTRRRMKLDDREILKRASVNPITSFPGSGYEITEVRTTQEQFSALSFIHNRLLLCYAKKVLNQTLRPLLFQLNNDLARNAFVSVVTPIFDRIKKLNGLDEYKVEVLGQDELNDRTTLYGRITITPLYPVEQIIVEFVLNDQGTSFTQ